jgi:hypothetical protein
VWDVVNLADGEDVGDKTVNLLCRPLLTPQIVGTGLPPLTMNWSDWHLLSTVSGWARDNVWKSNLTRMWYSDWPPRMLLRTELRMVLRIVKRMRKKLKIL